MALGIGDPTAGGGTGVLCLDLAGLVSVALQCLGDVVEFLGELILVTDVVCSADEGLVD